MLRVERSARKETSDGPETLSTLASSRDVDRRALLESRICTSGGEQCVLYDPSDPRPKRRYKMTYNCRSLSTLWGNIPNQICELDLRGDDPVVLSHVTGKNE
eukprot:3009214-Amphidinium_carterae.2